MNFDQLFVTAALAAFGMIAAILAWTVKGQVTATALQSKLVADLGALTNRVVNLERSRTADQNAIGSVQADVAFIRGFLQGEGGSAPATRRRKPTAT